MKRSSAWLLERKRDVYSQNGEDGIIEAILKLIPRRNKWCVEFGALDGIYLSNTRHLIESGGYSAVLIESDTRRFRDLQRNYAGMDRVIALNRMVGFTAHDSLDTILASTAIPRNFDLLSIDIDGNDYHTWKAVTTYAPRVVVIEFNPTIPIPVQFVQDPDPSLAHGASLSALVDLGKEKGYELVSVTFSNAFFVQRKYYTAFRIKSNDPRELWTDQRWVTYMFSGVDGTIFLDGCRMLPWHGIQLHQRRFQRLPALLRSHPGSHSRLRRIVISLYLAITEPGRIVRKVRRWFYSTLPENS